MVYERKTVAGNAEILYNSEYVADVVKLADNAFTNGVCKAGTPVSVAGAIANGATAYGITLHEVYSANPNATVVIGGYINEDKAESASGLTYAADMKSALKNVVFIDKD